MPRLRLSLKCKGIAVRATVLASLLYNTEARALLYADIDAMRKFLNRVIRGVVWRPSMGGTRAMEGKYTMTDFRLQLGLDDIEVYLVQRQLSYIGHLARYSPQRLEFLCLGAALPESARTARH
eukprot:742873-Amphidinium_carterae.1